MNTLILVILLPWAAGLTALVGGGIAAIRRSAVPTKVEETFSHGMVAFGGGVLFAAVLGYTTLQNMEVITAGIMSFAAGGILYLVFQDIAVQARIDGRAAPALGAVLGFAVGMMGNELIGTLL